ncbi:MAG: gliding motility protein GldC [Ignavibacteriaceae bacterium]
MAKKSEIRLFVELDDNRIPEKIEWEATDSGFNGRKEANSMMVSFWDKSDKVTLGIDLWTKEMLVDDMNIHTHQVLLKLADTYRKATKNAEGAELIENFASDFAEKLDLKKKVNRNLGEVHPKGEPY